MLFSNLTVPCCFFSSSSFIRNRNRKTRSLIAKICSLKSMLSSSCLRSIGAIKICQLSLHSAYWPTFMAKPFLCLSIRNQLLARKVEATLRISYQPYGYLSFLAESFDLIFNSVYPPLNSINLCHNKLQNPIIRCLSLSAETEVSISFLSTAPLMLTRLTLGCMFIKLQK